MLWLGIKVKKWSHSEASNLLTALLFKC